jgi:hypothetical protein
MTALLSIRQLHAMMPLQTYLLTWLMTAVIGNSVAHPDGLSSWSNSLFASDQYLSVFTGFSFQRLIFFLTKKEEK